MADIIFHQQPNLVQVNAYLQEADHFFTPALSQHLNLESYAEKIAANAHILWAVQDQFIVGMCAFYANHPPNAFLTSLSVIPEFQGRGIAKKLLYHLKLWCRENDCPHLSLEVYKTNSVANALYKQAGFQVVQDRNEKWLIVYKCTEDTVQL